MENLKYIYMFGVFIVVVCIHLILSRKYCYSVIPFMNKSNYLKKWWSYWGISVIFLSIISKLNDNMVFYVNVISYLIADIITVIRIKLNYK